MEQFLTELSKCRDPAVLLGVARILCGKLPEEPPAFEDLLTDILEKYQAAPRKRRRELLRILKAANKQSSKEAANGTT